MSKSFKKMRREPKEPRSEVAFKAIFERKGGPHRPARAFRERDDERSIIHRGMEDYERPEEG